MSKRDSVAAHLPSLAVMAEEMQVDSRHGPSGATASTTPPAYAAETPMLPGPSSSTNYGHQIQVDPRDLPFIMDWTRSGGKYHRSHCSRAAEWLSGWCRVAEAAIQSLSHSEWLNG